MIITVPGDREYPTNINSRYPQGNYFMYNISDVGFTNYINHNFRLNSISLGKNYGTDGKDIGIDQDILENATKCTIDGQCAQYGGLSSLSLLSTEQKKITQSDTGIYTMNPIDSLKDFLKNIINLKIIQNKVIPF